MNFSVSIEEGMTLIDIVSQIKIDGHVCGVANDKKIVIFDKNHIPKMKEIYPNTFSVNNNTFLFSEDITPYFKVVMMDGKKLSCPYFNRPTRII